MGEVLIGDIETDGLNPSIIHLVGVMELDGTFTAYAGDDVPIGLVRLAEADICVGHNFIKYDKVHIERLTEGLIQIETVRIIDTLDVARRLFPDLPKQKLEYWGEILGFPKLSHKDFSKVTPEMIEYCERDCLITLKMFKFFCEIESIEL